MTNRLEEKLENKIENNKAKFEIIEILTFSTMAMALIISPSIYYGCDKYREIDKKEIKLNKEYVN